jgi:hypothetical protein
MSLVILNFHGVGQVPRNTDDGERNVWLSETYFEAVLDLVCDHSNVRITVDDGNCSDFEIVLPALLRRGLRATFFLCSDRLDQPAFLSRLQVHELQAQGMSIGSHGITHVPWRMLSSDHLQHELVESRRALEAVCGIPVNSAACPFGDYDRRVLNGLRESGYRFVYTSDGGNTKENNWIQSRTTVTSLMSLEEVRQLMQLGASARRQWNINLRKFYKSLR